MIKKKLTPLFFYLLLLVATAQVGWAQRPMYCSFQSRENIRQEYLDLVIKKLQLNNKQVEGFRSILKELDQKRFEIWQEAHRIGRTIRGKAIVPESVSQAYIDAVLDARIKTAILEKEYYGRFAKVVPASKLIKLREINRAFGRSMAERMPDKPDL